MKHVTEFYVPALPGETSTAASRSSLCRTYDFYFTIDNEAYFKRDSLYGYFDDGERFAFFSKAICEAITKVPELASATCSHCNDWQTALCCVFLREFYQDVPQCANVKTIFTIHNVKFQGQYEQPDPRAGARPRDIPAARDQLRCDERSINFMKGALLYTDFLTTVSPSYAYELQMPFYGEGLDDIFRRRSGQLRGILNGIDQSELDDPTAGLDGAWPSYFSPRQIGGQGRAAKRALQQDVRACGQDPDAPASSPACRPPHGATRGLGLVTATPSTTSWVPRRTGDRPRHRRQGTTRTPSAKLRGPSTPASCAPPIAM